MHSIPLDGCTVVNLGSSQMMALKLVSVSFYPSMNGAAVNQQILNTCCATQCGRC